MLKDEEDDSAQASVTDASINFGVSSAVQADDELYFKFYFLKHSKVM